MTDPDDRIDTNGDAIDVWQATQDDQDILDLCVVDDSNEN
jgi:hypothetical protein